MSKETITLITTTGDEITIEYPDDVFEEMYEDYRTTQGKQEYWNVGNWTTVIATYKGQRLENINMTLIIGDR